MAASIAPSSLSPLQREVLRYLVDRYPRFLDRETLREALGVRSAAFDDEMDDLIARDFILSESAVARSVPVGAFGSTQRYRVSARGIEALQRALRKEAGT